MNLQIVLKALSDNTRLNIIELLLNKNYCVRALSKKLNISESAVSQHIKILKENNLLIGKKNGYHIHYDVNRDMLLKLAKQIELLANTKKDIDIIKECSCKCNKKNKCNME